MSQKCRRICMVIFCIYCERACILRALKENICQLWVLSLLQFKMVSMRLEKLICAPPRFWEVFPNVTFKTVSVFVWLTMCLSRKIVQRFLFLRLSPPGDRWCDVLGFVPAGSVSSFSTLTEGSCAMLETSIEIPKMRSQQNTRDLRVTNK